MQAMVNPFAFLRAHNYLGQSNMQCFIFHSARTTRKSVEGVARHINGPLNRQGVPAGSLKVRVSESDQNFAATW